MNNIHYFYLIHDPDNFMINIVSYKIHLNLKFQPCQTGENFYSNQEPLH